MTVVDFGGGRVYRSKCSEMLVNHLVDTSPEYFPLTSFTGKETEPVVTVRNLIPGGTVKFYDADDCGTSGNLLESEAIATATQSVTQTSLSNHDSFGDGNVMKLYAQQTFGGYKSPCSMPGNSRDYTLDITPKGFTNNTTDAFDYDKVIDLGTAINWMVDGEDLKFFLNKFFSIKNSFFSRTPFS